MYKWEDIQVLWGAGKAIRTDPNTPEGKAQFNKIMKQGLLPILDCAQKRCKMCNDKTLNSPTCQRCLKINCATERERGKQVFRSLPGQEYDFEIVGGQNYFKMANI